MIGEGLFGDLRYGIRGICRSPGFTAVALLTLALGIAGNTIIFSAINGILIEHWPYADASRLLVIEREQIAWGITFDEARTIEEQTTAFEEIAIADGIVPMVMSEDGIPARRASSNVSGRFFSMLGVEPLLGRYIVPGDTDRGALPVAVLSYETWLETFGGDEDVVGRDVLVEGNRYSVIGVMPKLFDLGVVWGNWGQGLWMPIVDARPGRRNSRLIAKVKEGMPIAAAKDQIAALSPRLAERFPAGTENVAVIAEQPRLDVASNVRNSLLLLQVAVAFVLLLACVNVSALLVARAWTRQRDLAIRKTLGATRLRIVRQLLSESLILALGGGAFGFLLAIGGIRVLLAIAPPGTPRLDRIQLDGNVLLFTLGVSVLSAVLFGLLPAWQAARRKGDFVREGLSAISVRSPTRQRHLLRNGLVMLEVALAVVLVVAGGLMARSFTKLMQIDPGVEADRALVARVELSRSSCTPTCETVPRSVLDAVGSLPGVEQAALSLAGPLGGGMTWPEIRFEDSGSELPFDGLQNYVTPGFFQAAGMRLLRGRDFAVVGDANAAVVNEAFVRQYVNGEPLGQRFSVSVGEEYRTALEAIGEEAADGPLLEIIGVVNDTTSRAIGRYGLDATFYTPTFTGGSFWTLIVRTFGDPNTLARPVQQVIRSNDETAVISSIETLEQSLYESAALPRFYTTLFGAFGLLALLLAVIGVYGVTTHSVVQRTHEIGVRMALGAQSRHVIWRFIAENALVASAGVALGLAGAMALARAVAHMLFEIEPLDPITFTSVAALLFVAALIAVYLPARAATRVSPVAALRHE